MENPAYAKRHNPFLGRKALLVGFGHEKEKKQTLNFMNKF